MHLLPMRYYITVVEHQSISRAAEALFLTQQTLSGHIAAMERELGCRLFQRKPRFQLTRAGEVFYRYCLQFQKLHDAMSQELRDLARPDSEVLRVGISQTRSRILMPPVLTRLQETAPYLQIHLSEQINEVLLERLLKGELDVMLGDVPEYRPELRTQVLYQEHLVLAVPKKLMTQEEFACLGAGEGLERLAAYPFVMNAQNDVAGRYGRVLLERMGIVPKVAALSDSAETCLQLCRDGLGLYICADLYPRFFSECREQVYILPLPLSYPIKLAVREGLYTKAGVKAFLACCLEDGVLDRGEKPIYTEGNG